MQERVYRTKVRDIEDLRAPHHSSVGWILDQAIIDVAVKQWRLSACVAANGGQFEHKLWLEYHVNYLKYAYYNSCWILIDLLLSY